MATIAGCICGERLTEVLRRPDGERWCFVCRKRRDFEYVLRAPVDPESWYGPTPDIQCASCHTSDGDCFPGTWREWED
jgi:hypothetical protein